MEKQRLFTEEELARVETEEERKHLIECEKDNSKIDMRYFNLILCERDSHNRRKEDGQNNRRLVFVGSI